MKRLKKVLALLMIFSLLAVYPVSNFISIIKEDFITVCNTEYGEKYIKKLSSADIAAAEGNVMNAQLKREILFGFNPQPADFVLDCIEKGTVSYKQAFRNVYIAGDSLMKGLEVYDILNKDHIVAKISVGLSHLKENRSRIVSKRPPILILHYGVNVLGDSDASLAGFIEVYTENITALKKALPGTRIIVSSIFPVDRKKAKAKRFKRIKAYNAAIKEMCFKNGVEYLDNGELIKQIEYSYDADGIHFKKSFYSRYWLKYVIKELGKL